MKQKLFLMLTAVMLSLMSFTAQAENVITMTTSNAVGSNLQLNIEATGAVTIDGATGTYKSGEDVTYTLTKQTITITGDVTSLDCGGNKLTALDVSKNTTLTVLCCDNNYQLPALNVTKNTALAVLHCYRTKITELDVTKNTALQELFCFDTLITVLDVSKNTALIDLYCNDNQLTALDVSKNTALTVLECEGNKLTVLDVNNNTALGLLYCGNNKLTALDVSKNTALKSLWCYGNQFKGAVMDALIASLVDRTGAEEAGKFVVVSDLETDANRNTCTTTQVAVAKAKNWTSYNYDKDHNLVGYAGYTPSTNVITMTTSKAVGSSLKLYIKATGAVTIDGATGTYESGKTVTYTTTAQTITITGDVTILDCGSNKLTALDLIKNTALERLYCYNNQLTALDVSKNTALTVLDCGSNKLTVLDVNNNTALTELICYDNQLTVLDVSKNTVLTYLDCSGNQLTALDVSKNTALTKLWCFGNQFKGAVMDALIASLVDRTGAEEAGQFVVVSDLETDANRNTCTTTQVAAAKAKNWTSYNWDNADRKLAEYAGSEPNVIEGVQTGDDATPTAMYDVSGRRIGQMQRGINIVKMRNGRTRKVMK